jgi:GR25 family glycosyltransferase involved in LPS biosynthesis
MKAFVIALPEQHKSVDVLSQSIKDTESDIDLEVIDATTPDTMEEHLKTEFKYWNSAYYKWTWPRYPAENRKDLATGLDMFAYQAADQRKKEACSISHMRLWDKCVELDETIVIFEADAVLTRKFDPNLVHSKDTINIIGLNDPRYTTRRANIFLERVSVRKGIQPVPTINRSGEFAPQGLAGGSAYLITPPAARELLDKIRSYGVWPNDAYICKELFPFIRVIYPFFTKVQGTVSTTTR